MKGHDEVIRDFNEYVNMTADELEKWLKSDDSRGAGWPKGGDGGGGESVGHDSGRKIVEILKANPKKDPKKYSDDQIDHMRKVASYCARHLAQEEKSNDSKSADEVRKTKSYASLKNWGHDPLKKRSGAAGAKGKSGATKTSNETEKNGNEENKADEKKADSKHAGDKRKAQDSQKGQNKEQKTEPRATRSSTRNKPAEEKHEGDDKKASSKTEKQTGRGGKAEKSESAPKKTDSKKETESKSKRDSNGSGKPIKGPKPGDTVSWNWGSGQPQGKVLDVKGEKTTITTKRGNKVSRDGDPQDPAVVLDTGKSKAIKSAHELN